LRAPGSDPAVLRPVFESMMEVKVYFKGRFLVNSEPKYYPVFWGFITSVSEDFGGGVYRMSLNCAEMLHWWEYCVLNVRPGATDEAVTGGFLGTSATTIFGEKNPYEILYDLTKSTGMGNFVPPTSIAQATDVSVANLDIRENEKSLNEYWNTRFQSFSGNLRMYGMSGTPVDNSGKKSIAPIIKL